MDRAGDGKNIPPAIPTRHRGVNRASSLVAQKSYHEIITYPYSIQSVNFCYLGPRSQASHRNILVKAQDLTPFM